VLVGLLKEWLLDEPHAAEHTEADWFRAHVNRGLAILPRRVRTLADVADLAAEAA
jgi:hypothetical protein